MIIRVNGTSRELPDGTSVARLIEILELTSRRVAVERNRAIVRKDAWGSTVLIENDELEILHFVGGGC